MSGSKKSKASAEDKSYTPGDIVLAKVKGYPSWPGRVVPNEMAPPAVRRVQPGKGKSSFLIQFFPTGDYSWSPPRDISTLTDSQITAHLTGPGKKSGDLYDAYKVAENPAKWIASREKLEDAAEDERAQLDTEDQLASGDEDGGKGGAKSKKRKRKSEAAPAKKEPVEEKKAKKAKVEKEKLAKSRTAGAAPKKAAAVHSEDEAPAKKSKSAVVEDEDPGLKQVKDWRHKLQKVFLGKNPPTAEELPKCKEYFDSMEKFTMTREWLAESKLGKVLKRITVLVDGHIPNGDEYGFRSRAVALAKSWSVSLGERAADEGTPVPSNGVAKVEADAEPTPVEEVVKPAEEVKPTPVAEPVVAPPADDAPAPMDVDEVPKPNGAVLNGDAPAKVEDAAPVVPEAVAPTPIEA